MRKRVPFGRHIKPEVNIDAVTALLRKEDGVGRYFSCERKRKYKTEKNAAMQLKRIKKKGLIVENANIYKCEFCNKFHLGHKRKTD